MPAQHQIPSSSQQCQPPVSMQERIVVSRQQQTTDSSISTLVLPTDSVIKSFPSIMTGTNMSIQSIQSTDLNHDIMVRCHEGMQISTQVDQSHPTSDNVYNLSEIVQKEKGALFRAPDKDIELEPPRPDVLTVRMRNQKFFTLMEEDEDSDKTPTENRENPFLASANVPLYTPFFNIGQGMHNIFGTHGKRKNHRTHKNQAPSRMDTDSNDIQVKTKQSSCGYESEPENFVQLYEKITTHPLRRNSSHPNLETASLEDFNQQQTSKNLEMSKSLPTTPRVSPKFLRRRNSNTNLEAKSKVDTSGPGFSFLASVAGELRSHRKRHTSNTSESQMVQASSEFQTVPKRPSSAEQPRSETKTFTNLEEKRTFTDMETLTTDVEPQEGKSFMKAVFSWGTTTQVSPSQKETNMYSPCSF